MLKAKFYLSYENRRNSHHRDLFIALIKAAMGCKEVVIAGHHFVCDFNNDLNTLNEIPSADTLLFDHDVMTAVFGASAVSVMSHAASIPVPARDEYVRSEFEKLGKPIAKDPVSLTWWSLPIGRSAE